MQVGVCLYTSRNGSLVCIVTACIITFTALTNKAVSPHSSRSQLRSSQRPSTVYSCTFVTKCVMLSRLQGFARKRTGWEKGMTREGGRGGREVEIGSCEASKHLTPMT